MAYILQPSFQHSQQLSSWSLNSWLFPVRVHSSAYCQRMALQGQLDVFDCLIRLFILCAVGDLIRVELEINAADGDDFYLMQGWFSTKSSSA